MRPERRMLGGIWRSISGPFRRRHAPPESAKLVVLIDGDAIAPKEAAKILDHVRTLGRICVARAYGNLSGRTAAAWTALIRQHGIVARHMPSVALGKNASDIGIAVDAVELLLTRDLDAFVLIASDADFTPLAIRLRESGKDVIGFGRKSTPISFRNACTSFREIHKLSAPRAWATSAPAQHRSPLPAEAEELVLASLVALSADDQPVALADLGQHLVANNPGFDSRNYSRRTLTALLRDLSSVTVLEDTGTRCAKLAKSLGQEWLDFGRGTHRYTPAPNESEVLGRT